jgi:hypothetical protein
MKLHKNRRPGFVKAYFLWQRFDRAAKGDKERLRMVFIESAFKN